jgi:hypothetical protein
MHLFLLEEHVGILRYMYFCPANEMVRWGCFQYRSANLLLFNPIWAEDSRESATSQTLGYAKKLVSLQSFGWNCILQNRLRSVVFHSLPTEQSGPVGRFTWERGFSSRNRKGQLWEYLLSRIFRLSECLTWELERGDVLRTYELYAWFQVFYWVDANDLGGQGCHGKVSWWFHSRDGTYSPLFLWVSAVTGISPKTRVKISFQCRNCCSLVDLHTAYICPCGASWMSLVWICWVVLFDQTFILF